jgi:diacylglycerol kinase family enzyme
METFRDLARQTAAQAISLDVMYSRNNYALNYCCIGTESMAVLNTIAVLKTLYSGGPLYRWLAYRLYEQLYYVGGVPACLDKRFTRQRYDIEIDGEDLGGQYRGILIANGSYYGGNKHPRPAARPDDGMLDISLARGAGFLRTAIRIPAYMRGRLEQYPGDFILRRGRKISVRSRRPLLICFDDTIFYDTDFTVELLPQAVRFADPSGQGYRGALARG